MAKKKTKASKNMVCLIKKGVALLAAVVTFVFFFLEMLAVKSVSSSSLFGNTKTTTTDGVTFAKLLFNEDYEIYREELGLTTVILWVVFVLVILSILALVASFVAKKSIVAKFGAGVLVVALLLLFVVNLDKATIDFGSLGKKDTFITNITALYFIALGLSAAGLGATVTLKK